MFLHFPLMNSAKYMSILIFLVFSYILFVRYNYDIKDLPCKRVMYMNQQVNIKPRALIQRVTERMFSMRKKASVEKLPYTPYAGYHTSWPGFWFSKVIDRPLCEGDYIYAIAELPGLYRSGAAACHATRRN